MRALYKGALACLGACLLFAGCDFIAADTEALLTPPTITQRQAQLDAALEQALGADDIVYRYPQHGEYRSPFLFYDMDGDGLEEAVVFYATAAEPDYTRTMVLIQEGGGWSALQDFPTQSRQVEFVEFAPLKSADTACMLIGWQGEEGAGGDERFLGVYSLEAGRFRPEVERQNYIAYTVRDFDGDGLAQVVAVEYADDALWVTLLHAAGSRIAAAGTVALNPDVDALLRITPGTLWDGSTALYIDEERRDGAVATEILRVAGGEMRVLAGGLPPGEGEPTSPAWENYSFTFRSDDVLCMDIQGDGQVEVPAYELGLPGSLDAGAQRPLQLTLLLHLTETGFEIWQSAVVNREEGYLVLFPDRWENVVAVSREDDTGQWHFFLMDLATEEPTVELLRIQAYTASVSDTLGPEEIALGSRGTRHFVGYIPRTGQDVAEGIAEEELPELFWLLPQGSY